MPRYAIVILCTAAIATLSVLTFLCAADLSPRQRQALPATYVKLLPLHKKMEAARPGEWLDKHKELGQDYRRYLDGQPIRADRIRRTIYIQPLGEFNESEEKIVDLTAELMGLYFQLPVKKLKPMSLHDVPDMARRKRADEDEQLLTSYLLMMLERRLPRDGSVLIGFTTADLWPGAGWNYVFGQASLKNRVGVWSIHRYGDPSASDAAFRLCLLRTMKTATHETCHMFSMAHCIFFQCNMCGSNHLAETDRHPLELCPVCLAKLVYATGANPARRFSQLADFYDEHGFKDEADFCRKSLAAIEKP